MWQVLDFAAEKRLTRSFKLKHVLYARARATQESNALIRIRTRSLPPLSHPLIVLASPFIPHHTHAAASISV